MGLSERAAEPRYARVQSGSGANEMGNGNRTYRNQRLRGFNDLVDCRVGGGVGCRYSGVDQGVLETQ